MKNVSAPKNSKSGAPSGARNMGGGSGTSKPMPRVGGHTTNTGNGAPGPGNGDKGC